MGVPGQGLPRRGPDAHPRLLRGHRRVVDEEVERILRAQEDAGQEILEKHRGGLDAIARALLDNEIIDGAEVARLVDEAYGSPVHSEGAKSVPHFHEAAITAPASNGGGANGSNGVG